MNPMIPALLFAAVLFTACSAKELYGSRQAWQRNECKKLPDKADYDRCMSSAATDYDTYKRETEGLNKR
jgi:hypothetical protein